jgi:hypothetical protein
MKNQAIIFDDMIFTKFKLFILVDEDSSLLGSHYFVLINTA